MTTGLTFDAGALIAVDRRSARMTALLARAADRDLPVAVPVGVLAQAWRGGPRQARLAAFLASPDVEVVGLDEDAARAAGILCGRTRTRDVVDASVVVCARARGDAIVTSDENDLRRLDPDVELITL